MSSRQEEKEQRRRERLAREAEATAAARRKRLVGLASGGVLALAIVVAIVVAVTGGGGGKAKRADSRKTQPPAHTTPIPAAKVTDLAAAVKAAGCKTQTFIPGPGDRVHITGAVTYKQDPPVFGPHYPVPLSDGDYAHVKTPATEQAVHAMEHGRVIIWFKPSAVLARGVSQLETLFNEPIAQGAPPKYKQLLIARPDMPAAVAATAWGQQLTCPRFNAKVFDALRSFRRAFVDHAPESQIPFPE